MVYTQKTEKKQIGKKTNNKNLKLQQKNNAALHNCSKNKFKNSAARTVTPPILFMDIINNNNAKKKLT